MYVIYIFVFYVFVYLVVVGFFASHSTQLELELEQTRKAVERFFPFPFSVYIDNDKRKLPHT